MDLFYAHTLDGERPDRWQFLEDHLRNVANLASARGTTFGAEEWARTAGLWHDLGKYSDAFQRYLRAEGSAAHEGEASGRVDHSTAGAQHAVLRLPVLGHLLAFVLAGHHGGLPDSQSDGIEATPRRSRPALFLASLCASAVPPSTGTPRARKCWRFAC